MTDRERFVLGFIREAGPMGTTCQRQPRDVVHRLAALNLIRQTGWSPQGGAVYTVR